MIGRFACTSMEEWICQLWNPAVECEDHYDCHWLFLRDKREISPPLQARVWPTTQGNGIQTSTVLETVLAITREAWREVEENYTTTTHRQRIITNFFSSINLSMLQFNEESWPQHLKGATLDSAIAIFCTLSLHSCRIWPPDKDHYHLVPKVLPLLRGPIHLGSAHVGDLPNAEVFILCEFRTFSSSLTRIFCNLYLAIFNLIVLADETTFMMQSVIWFHRPSINMLIHISFFLYQQRCDGRTW